MNRPRFTIGRLMVIVAIVAVYLGLARAFPDLHIILLGLGSLGGFALLGMVGMRPHPRLLPSIVLKVYLILTVAALVGGRFGIAPVWILLPLMMIAAQPIIFGGGIAWLRKPALKDRLSAWDMLWEIFIEMVIVLPAFLVVIVALVFCCVLWAIGWNRICFELS